MSPSGPAALLGDDVTAAEVCSDRRFWFGVLPGPGTGFLPQNIGL